MSICVLSGPYFEGVHQVLQLGPIKQSPKFLPPCICSSSWLTNIHKCHPMFRVIMEQITANTCLECMLKIAQL